MMMLLTGCQGLGIVRDSVEGKEKPIDEIRRKKTGMGKFHKTEFGCFYFFEVKNDDN